MAFDWILLISQVGVPSAIAIYLIWFITTRHEKALQSIAISHKAGLSTVSKAINQQTKTLNHTLTEQIKLIKMGIENQASKQDIQHFKKKLKKCDSSTHIQKS